MNRNREDRLDELLGRWAHLHAPTRQDVERLQARITGQLAEEAEIPARPSPADRSEPGRRALRRKRSGSGRAARWVAMIAVAAALAILLSLPRHRQANERAPILPAGEDVAARARLLSELERLFDGRLVWMVEADSRILLGLEDGPPTEPPRQPTVQVRLLVTRRDRGDPAWKPVWSADIVVRDEEVLQLSEESLEAGRLTLWTYVLPDGAIAVDTDLTLRGPAAIHTTESSLHVAGQPIVVHSQSDGHADYQVLQTAALIGDRKT